MRRNVAQSRIGHVKGKVFIYTLELERDLETGAGIGGGGRKVKIFFCANEIGRGKSIF